jgi:hypothetical protein
MCICTIPSLILVGHETTSVTLDVWKDVKIVQAGACVGVGADRELLRVSVVCEQQRDLTCKWSVRIRACIHLYIWSYLDVDTILLFVRRPASALRAPAPRMGTSPASSLSSSPSSPLQTVSYPRTQPACSIPESRSSSPSSGTAQVRARRSG